ncbi:hypothetical protein, partial [Escherichia coli]|uniref:hypothetical protein n=2 Tax=Escherichia coli TaxID=562 RepID=UPI001A7EB914
ENRGGSFNMRNADELQESFASPLEFKQTCTIIISAYRHTIATLPPFNKIQIQKNHPKVVSRHCLLL